ncbi:hypothetical protein ACFX2H_022532 [Malus domestica]
MGAICCLEEIGQVKIVEVQNGSSYRQKFKCALNVLHTSIKISTRWDFRGRRGELRNRRSQFKDRRGASFLKSWACSQTTDSRYRRVSAFSASSAPVTRKLSFAKITGSLSKRQFQPSVSFSLVSTCHMQRKLCENHAQSVENFWRSGMHVKSTVKLSQACRHE